MRKDPDKATLKFLVIRRDNIGDLVCTTPIFRALRTQFPAARIDALVNTYNLPVLQNNPDINKTYAYTKGKHRPADKTLLGVYWERIKLMYRLKREGYDYAILSASPFVPHALRLARAIKPKHIIGYTEPNKRGTQYIDIAIPYTSPRPMHEVEDIFRLLSPLGIQDEPPATVIVPSEDEIVHVKQLIRQQKWSAERIVGVHIGAREADNRWPLQNFIDLIKSLHETEKVGFMLFWSPGEDSDPLYPGDDGRARQVMEAIGELPVIACPTPHVQRLIAGLSQCDFVVCCDGGALHLAAALGRPILGLYCDIKKERWYPWKVKYNLLSRNKVRDIGVDEAVKGCQQLMGVIHKDIGRPASLNHLDVS